MRSARNGDRRVKIDGKFITINSWPILEGQTATFDRDDFEGWFLAGMTRADRFTRQHERELLENCIYLANREEREMTQSLDELRDAIHDWAVDWNRR